MCCQSLLAAWLPRLTCRYLSSQAFSITDSNSYKSKQPKYRVLHQQDSFFVLFFFFLIFPSPQSEAGKMRREGRPHGMVRAYAVLPPPWNPKPGGDRKFNKFDTPTTAGLFTKVSSKPTNHSKFTGKCGKPRCLECHLQPCCKAKHKTKGSHKVKSQDVLSNSNAQFIAWRVVNGRHGSNLSGFSATGMLNHLASTGDHDYADEVLDDSGHENDQEFVDDDDENYIGDRVNIKNIEEEDGMSYCDVGFEVDLAEGDEDWCLVAEKA
jgi:hypothetical protein